jgi:hypothetical protein
VHIQRLRGGEPLGVPDLPHDLLPRDHLAGIADQHPEQIELLRGQVQLLVAVPGPPGVRIDADPAHSVPVGRAAAEQGPHAREELGEAEWLRHVVVRAGVQPDHGVHLIGPRGEDQHGDRVSLRANATAHLEPVQLRQPDVEQDQVDFVRQRTGQGRRPVLGDLHLVALAAQRARQRFGDGGVVLREEYSGHG